MSIERAVARLGDAFGERAATGASILDLHSRDASHHTPVRPAAVVSPLTAEEVARVVGICAEEECPIIPWGVGTSLEGQVVPIHGGVTLSFERMNRVLAIHAEDMDAVVEPGVTREQLNEELRATGLFFPVDPGANATLGGMAATRASGTCAVRYGTMREVVMGLEVVLADGRVVRTGGRARKSSTGYDLTRLMVGSEGTLGIITELTLRLFGQPEAVSAATCAFPDIGAAVNAAMLTIQSGLPVARIELVDGAQMRCFNAWLGETKPETPHLFLEFHGSPGGVAEQAEAFGDIAREFGGATFEWAEKAEDRARLWKARHNAYFAAKAQAPGKEALATDACVPISRLADCITETVADLGRSGLFAPIVGHVGDGNFHVQIMIDPADAAERARADAFTHRLAERTLAMDGTVSGEHGIGIGKKKYMGAEHGEAWDVMGEIKRALDPKGLFNPGKLLRSN